MANHTAMSPVEFGTALREQRLGAGISLETISERTKIGRRTLEAIESGEFGKLPDRVFVRMFLQQVVEIVGGDRETWLASFDGAWDRYTRGSQQFQVPPNAEVRPRRSLGPWIIGILLVAMALALVLVMQRHGGGDEAVELPTPTEVATAIAPTPLQEAAPPDAVGPMQLPEAGGADAATPTPQAAIATEPVGPASDLVFTTAAGECWVQVAVEGGATASRLLPPQARWDVTTGSAAADIVIGAAGAVVVTYRGREVPVTGRPGSVVRLRVPPPEEG